jgi:predicted transcriptional regulator of viral defense system
MRDTGEVQELSRGVFRLADRPIAGDLDLITVAKRVCKGVLCLISALSYHELTTQIPHEVQLALPRTARHPRIDYPPLRIFRFSAAAYSAGIEVHQIDGVPVRVYSPEKTIADCFKFRNKIGLDVAIEGLRSYRKRGRPKLQSILDFARICRVESVIRPYLEATA